MRERLSWGVPRCRNKRCLRSKSAWRMASVLVSSAKVATSEARASTSAFLMLSAILHLYTRIIPYGQRGKVELAEPLENAKDGRVIVTLISSNQVELELRDIEPSQAADLRHRLASFAEDWDRPEMNAYDDLPARMPMAPFR